MYLSGIDEGASVVMMIFSPGRISDDEYERSIQDLRRVDAVTATRARALAHVVISDVGAEPPSAKWRKRFAEAGEAVQARPYYFAFVTESTLLRGMFTAVFWLRAARSDHHVAAFSSFELACAWLRRQSGAAYPQLESLYASARSRAAARIQ